MGATPYARPPNALPSAHTASSAPASSGAPSVSLNAGSMTSSAPIETPNGSIVSTSVRIAGERSGPSRPPRWRSATRAAGRRARNVAFPATAATAESTSATVGENTATISAVSSGPTTNESSTSTESSA